MKGNLALGSRRQALLLGSLGLVLVLAVVRWRPGGAAPPSPTPTANSPARRSGPASAGEDDAPSAAPAPKSRRPSARDAKNEDVTFLNPADFDPPHGSSGSDSGRDLFELRLPTAVPPPTATPRPPLPCEAAYVGPCGPPTPTPKPRPPDVTFKFLGSFGPRDHPIAVIQQGDEVFNARAGDTLFGKFVLRNVGYESIDVGFVGFEPTETKRLPVSP